MTNQKEDKSISKFFENKPKGAGLFPSLEYVYRGANISWLRSTMSWGTYLIPEAIIREQIIKLSPRVTVKDKEIPHIPLPEQIFIGASGGVINALCMLPFDAVKTNVQKPEYTGRATIQNMLKVGKNLVSEHGIRKGLYRGFCPRLIHYSIVGILTEGVMQKVDQIWAEHIPTSNSPTAKR